MAQFKKLWMQCAREGSLSCLQEGQAAFNPRQRLCRTTSADYAVLRYKLDKYQKIHQKTQWQSLCHIEITCLEVRSKFN